MRNLECVGLGTDRVFQHRSVDDNLHMVSIRLVIMFIYLFKVQYPMYIMIRVQWTYNDIHNNHSRYTL